MDLVIVTLGDSLTAGYGVGSGRGWACQLAGFYPEAFFYYRGIPGDTTDGMFERWRYEAGHFQEQPDVLFFMGGSNDLLLGFSPQHIMDNLKKIHRVCIVKHVRLIILQCPHMARSPGPCAWFPPSQAEKLNEGLDQLHNLVRYYAQENQIFCIEVPEVLTQPGFGESDILLEDGVHLTEWAHEKIARYIFECKIL